MRSFRQVLLLALLTKAATGTKTVTQVVRDAVAAADPADAPPSYSLKGAVSKALQSQLDSLAKQWNVSYTLAVLNSRERVSFAAGIEDIDIDMITAPPHPTWV